MKLEDLTLVNSGTDKETGLALFTYTYQGETLCPHCGSKKHIFHKTEQDDLFYLDLEGDSPVKLRVKSPNVYKCTECHTIYRVRLDDTFLSMTRPFLENVLNGIAFTDMSYKDLNKIYHLSDAKLRRLSQAFWEENLPVYNLPAHLMLFPVEFTSKTYYALLDMWEEQVVDIKSKEELKDLTGTENTTDVYISDLELLETVGTLFKDARIHIEPEAIIKEGKEALYRDAKKILRGEYIDYDKLISEEDREEYNRAIALNTKALNLFIYLKHLKENYTLFPYYPDLMVTEDYPEFRAFILKMNKRLSDFSVSWEQFIPDRLYTRIKNKVKTNQEKIRGYKNLRSYLKADSQKLRALVLDEGYREPVINSETGEIIYNSGTII